MLTIAGGIILGVVGLWLLGALLSIDWGSSAPPAPPSLPSPPDPKQLKTDWMLCLVSSIPILCLFGFLIHWLVW
jgi:hypothetical protein